MRLNELSPGKGAKKVGKRLGRGHSAGQGKTSGPRPEGPALRARAAITRSASKAARCRCSGACRRSGFNSRMAKYSRGAAPA